MASTEPKDRLQAAVVIVTLALVYSVRHAAHAAPPRRPPAQRQQLPASRDPRLKPRVGAPCNIVWGTPSANWSSPRRPAVQPSRAGWSCEFVNADGLPDIALPYRWLMRGKQPKPEQVALESRLAWFPENRTMCFPSAERRAAATKAASSAGECPAVYLTPDLKWLYRAGMGNRYFILGATIALAAEEAKPFVTDSGLGWAGGPLPQGSLDPADVACARSGNERRWKNANAPGKPFYQDKATVARLVAQRESVCELLAQPDYFAMMRAQLPRASDIVVYLRELSLAPTSYFQAAIEDAKANHGGKRVVVVSKRCMLHHPVLESIVKEHGAITHSEIVTSSSKGVSPSLDLQFVGSASILIIGSASTFGWWGAFFGSGHVYFPIMHTHIYFNPWCDLLVDLPRYSFVDGPKGEILADVAAANKVCAHYGSTTLTDKRDSGINRLYPKSRVCDNADMLGDIAKR